MGPPIKIGGYWACGRQDPSLSCFAKWIYSSDSSPTGRGNHFLSFIIHVQHAPFPCREGGAGVRSPGRLGLRAAGMSAAVGPPIKIGGYWACGQATACAVAVAILLVVFALIIDPSAKADQGYRYLAKASLSAQFGHSPNCQGEFQRYF